MTGGEEEEEKLFRRRSFCERHRGCNFMWKAMLVLIPMAGALYISLFVSWRHDDCGPKYTSKCSPSEKDAMVTISAWSFATCVLLVAVPFCSACTFSWFKHILCVPDEVMGLLCYTSAMATAIGALHAYFQSSIVFSDGLFKTSNWGQWFFVLPLFGVFIVPFAWGTRTYCNYREEMRMRQVVTALV